MVRRKSKMPTMKTSVVSLNSADEGIDDIGQRHPQRLRQNDKRHHAPVWQARAPAPPHIGRAGSRQARRARPPPYRPKRTARRRSARATSLSGENRSGTNSGSMTLAMNSTVISGTPRTNSMKLTENNFTTGICDRRPTASRMPSGSETTMPTVATTMVTSMPPHSDGRHRDKADKRHAAQQDERQDRQDDEEIDRADVAARRRNQASQAMPNASATKNRSTRQRSTPDRSRRRNRTARRGCRPSRRRDPDCPAKRGTPADRSADQTASNTKNRSNGGTIQARRRHAISVSAILKG